MRLSQSVYYLSYLCPFLHLSRINNCNVKEIRYRTSFMQYHLIFHSLIEFSYHSVGILHWSGLPQ